ncbi:MAG: dihydroorotate dehydrogenase electron transfer subunit [Chloroflexi bacterium]|nr:dihydroorotate dehydrogenase electron transfer subunit [Chloroflexota bacterium]
MTLPQTVRIREIRDETRTIRTFVLDAEIPGAEPGQFIMLWLPGVDEKPMSIACPAPLTVTVARVGPFSTALYQRKVGDQVGWRGPYGHGFSLPLSQDRRALLVSGGYGVGPIYFLAVQAVERGIPTTVALGARTALDLPYIEQFRALQVDLILATDDGSLGYRGYVTDAISEFMNQDLQSTIYTCGPEPMLVTIHRLCRERDIPGQLCLERYMKCGFGICGQCSLDELLVCEDGPVFDVEQMDDLQDFGHTHRSATGRQMPIH